MPTAAEEPDFDHVLGLTVRFGDLDPLGHLNNVAIVRMLETGRVEHCRELGLMEATTPTFVLVALNVTFRAQGHYRDELRVGTRVAGIGRTSFTLQQRLWRPADARTIIDGESVLVVVGEDMATPVPVPDAMRARRAPDPG